MTRQSGFSNIKSDWKNGYLSTTNKAGFPVTPLATPFGLTVIDDFTQFDVTDDYTVTAVGVATETITGPTGILTLLNAAANDDSDQIQFNWEFYKFEASKKLWFQTRLKVSDATESDLIAGLAITDTTLIAGVSDAIYFSKVDGDPELLFVTEKGSTPTSTNTGIDMADDTYIDLAFWIGSATSATAFINGVEVATNTTNIPDTEDLTPSFAIQNGEAVAKSMSIDYWRVDIER